MSDHHDTMPHTFRSRMTRDDTGAGMVEYALLVLLVGVALVTALGLLAGGLWNSFADSASRF